MITKHWILTNPITRRLYARWLHFLDGQNIERELQNIALNETARFVMEKMAGVPSFPNDFALLKHAWEQVDKTREGLVCEFGVWRGTTINYLASLTSQTIYGFDSFEGLPERWRDGFEAGRFRVSRLPKVRSNVKLLKGWFNQSLPPFLSAHPQPALFLHVDCDSYSSTKTVLDLFQSRIVPGTVLVFDEYFNYPGWQYGEAKAFDELIAATGLKYEWLGYCRYHEQVALRIE